jgi:hypothetical protein
LPTKSNRKHPPPETSPSQPDCKDPPENIVPTLKPVAEVVPRYSFRTNRTPAPSPPRVLRLPPINPYIPLDHTSDAHPAPSLELLTHAAAAVVDKRGKSADECSIPSFRSRQSSEEQIVGQKGSPVVDADNISDDDDYNSSVGTDTDDRSSNNKAYDKTAADDLYYSDDDFLDKDFYCEIDNLARTIEYLDPKKVKCVRRQTTLIQGGPQPPDYSGMTKAEKDMAKDAFKKKRKSWTDKLHRPSLTPEEEGSSGFYPSRQLHGLSSSHTMTNGRGGTRTPPSWSYASRHRHSQIACGRGGKSTRYYIL